MRRPLPPLLLPFALAACLVASSGPARAEDAPAPKLDRVDYRDAAALTALPAHLGADKRAASIARQLAGKSPRETLGNIARWLRRNLRLDAEKARAWRTVDEILADGSRGGDADLAMVFGVLARAARIPCAWVKTLEPAWILRFKAGGVPLDAEHGRVFLEVALDGRWVLLDPVEARVYEDYDPRMRILPGGRLAYDKGVDPHALVLPNRRALWEQQTRAWIGGLDLARVPWARSTDLLARWTVYITGKGGAASYARAACKTLGFNVEKTFATDFERVLPQVRGKTLIVTCRGTTPILPEKYWAAYLPPGFREIASGASKPEKGWVAHRLADGTRVILVTASEFGPVELAVSEALEG